MSNNSISFSCSDTPFYYRINGALRQALEMLITNQTGAPTSGIVTILAAGYDDVTTEIPLIKEGAHKYVVYAPCVYPNFGVMPEYQAGYHRPVIATVELKIKSKTITKKVKIGTYRPWTIYVCQDVCTDFTFGNSEFDTKKLSIELTDIHLKTIDNKDKNPPCSQNRWNINQTMEVLWYLEEKSPDEIKKLFSRERDGHIQISPIFNSCLTGIMTTEQAIRSLYFGRKLEREYKIDISTVEHIEVPTIAWGMASIFANAGIKYFVKGWLDYQAPFCTYRDDISLFFWEGPDGSKVLVACDKGASQHANYAQASFLSKDYEDAVRELHEFWIPHFEQRTNYPYDAFILLGSHGDLGPHSSEQVSKVVSNIIRYNEEPWEYPKIVIANWRQFFKHIEEFSRKYSITIPVLRGDYGCSWEEWTAAMAVVVAGMRRGVQRFVTAEKLATLSYLLSPESYEKNSAKLKEATFLMEMLAEHAWVGSASRPNENVEAFCRKNKWQMRLNKIVDEVITDGLNMMGRSIPTEEFTLLVFNPLPWTRNDIAEIDLLEIEKIIGSGTFKLTDKSTGEKIPSEVVKLEGKKILRFEARNIPPIGYKTYTLQPVSNDEEPVSALPFIVKDNIIENKYYRVKVDPLTGGLLSIFDKQRRIDIVDEKSSYKMNQYLELSERKEQTQPYVKISQGPVGAVSGNLIIETSYPSSRIEAIITLYSNINRIDITNKIHKTPSSERIQVYFVFPFNVPNSVYHYDTLGAIIKPGLTQYGGEQLEGSGQTSHSCTSFVDVSNNDYGVTLAIMDSFLIQFGHPTTFENPTCPDPSNSTVFSLVMANKNYRESIRDQGGVSDFVFRYSIRSHDGGFNGHSAVRFGWEKNNELLVKLLFPNQKGMLPSKEYSFVSCMPENVVITALKIAEEGPENGLIIRAWETDEISTLATFDVSALKTNVAIETDLLERDLNDLEMRDEKVFANIKSRGFLTIRLRKKRDALNS